MLSFDVHKTKLLYILEITKQLCESINFDFVIYDIFGAGELVKEYLQVPGVVSSPIFLIPPELKTLPFHPNADMPFQPEEISEKLLNQMEHKFGVKLKNNLQFMNNKGDVCLCIHKSLFPTLITNRSEKNNIFIGPSISKRKTNIKFPLESLKEKKVIYISMGTLLEGLEPFFNTCIDTFSDFDGIVVMAIGDRNDISKITIQIIL